VSQQPIDREIG